MVVIFFDIRAVVSSSYFISLLGRAGRFDTGVGTSDTLTMSKVDLGVGAVAILLLKPYFFSVSPESVGLCRSRKCRKSIF